MPRKTLEAGLVGNIKAMGGERFVVELRGRSFGGGNRMCFPAASGKVSGQRKTNKTASNDQNRFGHQVQYSGPTTPPSRRVNAISETNHLLPRIVRTEYEPEDEFDLGSEGARRFRDIRKPALNYAKRFAGHCRKPRHIFADSQWGVP